MRKFLFSICFICLVFILQNPHNLPINCLAPQSQLTSDVKTLQLLVKNEAVSSVDTRLSVNITTSRLVVFGNEKAGTYLHVKRNYPLNFQRVEFVIEKDGRRRLVALPEKMQQRLLHFLERQEDVNFMCFGFIYYINNITDDAVYSVIYENNLKLEDLKIGDSIEIGPLKDGRVSPSFHGAVYLGDGLFLSLMGGSVIVDDWQTMKSLYRVELGMKRLSLKNKLDLLSMAA